MFNGDHPTARVARTIVAVAPFVACALFYLPTLSGGLLSDDYSVLGALDAWRQEGRLVSTLIAKFHSGLDVPSYYYRPLPTASYALNYVFSGAAPFGWRLTNLVLHLLAGVLVFDIARRLGETMGKKNAIAGPTFAATIFLWFPTNVEAVAWVSGRYDLLATLFMLATVTCFQRSRRWRDAWGVAALVAAACAFASKESAALVPVFVLAIAVAQGWRNGAVAALSRGIRDAAPWLIVGAAYFAMRMAMFGTPFRVYPDTAPLAALLHGDWLHTLASSTAWLGAVLPNAFGRATFLVALSGLIVVGMLICVRRREFRIPWLALGAAALLSVGMLLPHLSVLAPNGEEGRLFYTTSALLALLVSFTISVPSRADSPSMTRVAAAVLAFALLSSEAVLLRAATATWTDAGAQATALLRALPAAAHTIPDGGYGIVVVPDHLGSVPFGRNAQGVLISPPAQSVPLSSRLVVQTPEDLPSWPSHVARGLVDALQRYPLVQAWPAVEMGQVRPGIQPSDAFCWDASRREIVRLGVLRAGMPADWLTAWQRALGSGPCLDAASELHGG
jgi:hypothetical protein